MKTYVIEQKLIRDEDYITQWLYELSKPVKYNIWEEKHLYTLHVVASYSKIPELFSVQGCGELYLFPSNKEGKIISHEELPGSRKGDDLDPDDIVSDFLETVEKANKTRHTMIDSKNYRELSDRVLKMDEQFGHFAYLHTQHAEPSSSTWLYEASRMIRDAADYCRQNPTFRTGDRVRILAEKDRDIPNLNLSGYTAVVTDPPSREDDTVEVQYDPPLPDDIVAVLDNQNISTDLNYYTPEKLELIERKENNEQTL